MSSAPRRYAVAGALLSLALGAAACGGSSSGSSGSSSATSAASSAASSASSAATSAAGSSAGASSSAAASGGGAAASAGAPTQISTASCKIALLLPETKTTRYEAHDKPDFIAAAKVYDPNCTIDYFNADQDASKQASQAQTAITNGDKVLVLDPVDGKAAASIVQQAQQANVPTVSYDRLVNGPAAFYVSFDNQKVGKLQGQALLQALQKDNVAKGATIVMINGSPTDPNAAQFKAGAMSVLSSSGYNIGYNVDTPDWSPNEAHDEMSAAITKLGANKIKGVYSANDGMAGGIIQAMQQAGMNPLPPVTGQDAQLDAIQRILQGTQYMTVYKAIKPEAQSAAQVAVKLATGTKASAIQGTSTLTNGSGNKVPSNLLNPVVVTADNVKDTVVKDGFYTVQQICTGGVQQACSKHGLS